LGEEEEGDEGQEEEDAQDGFGDRLDFEAVVAGRVADLAGVGDGLGQEDGAEEDEEGFDAVEQCVLVSCGYSRVLESMELTSPMESPSWTTVTGKEIYQNKIYSSFFSILSIWRTH